jgi:dTDP-N-acetylfucosamine:lipid II N-acetylfucosaminyltransferase
MARYIHILWHDELKFSSALIEMFNSKENGFVAYEHMFIIPYKEMYESFSKWENVALDDSFGEGKFAGLINKYAPQCDWLFLHSMCSPLESLKIKRKYYGKIIFRTWGGDLGYDLDNIPVIKITIKYMLNQRYKRMVRNFKAIGIANVVDAVNVKQRIGSVTMFRAPYPRKDSNKVISEIASSKKQQHDVFNVLIGHSGYKENNHIEILNKLERFKDEKIQIYIIASYGQPEYIEEVKKSGEKIFGSKIKIIEHFMPYKEYVEFLNNMDVAVFDGKISYALGNLNILRLLEKKIILNDKGVIRKAYDMEHYPYICSSKLNTITFEELKQPMEYPEEIRKKNKPRTYEENISMWRTILLDLDMK